MLKKLINQLQTIRKKATVVMKALPTQLGVISVALTVVGYEIVPLLPEETAVQVGGYIATVVAALAAIVRTISRLTPADPVTFGLLPPSK